MIIFLIVYHFVLVCVFFSIISTYTITMNTVLLGNSTLSTLQLDRDTSKSLYIINLFWKVIGII